MVAFSCELLSKVVLRSEPFHRTFELDVNPAPLTVRVKDGPPALTLVGLMLLIVRFTTGRLSEFADPKVPPSSHTWPNKVRVTCCADFRRAAKAVNLTEKSSSTGGGRVRSESDCLSECLPSKPRR